MGVQLPATSLDQLTKMICRNVFRLRRRPCLLAIEVVWRKGSTEIL